jgi:hypothetical protein
VENTEVPEAENNIRVVRIPELLNQHSELEFVALKFPTKKYD